MDAGPATILVVEDNQVVREAVVPELEYAGYAVVEAEDGQVALSILKAGCRADLLLRDIRMPGLGGWDLAQEARSLRPGLPMIYVTGYADEGGKHVPGNIILPKPYRPSQVVQAAQSLGVLPQPRNRPWVTGPEH